MITFKHHLNLSKKVSSVDDINTYLEDLKPLERIDFLDSFEETYPIKQTEFVTPYIKDHFNKMFKKN